MQRPIFVEATINQIVYAIELLTNSHHVDIGSISLRSNSFAFRYCSAGSSWFSKFENLCHVLIVRPFHMLNFK